jgi:hypothetical protein
MKFVYSLDYEIFIMELRRFGELIQGFLAVFGGSWCVIFRNLK